MICRTLRELVADIVLVLRCLPAAIVVVLFSLFVGEEDT